MPRLTFEGNFCDIAMCRKNPCPYNGMCSQRQVRERLKAYEDAGLEPEDLKQAFNETAILNLAAQALSTTPDHLRDLVQAEQDGRLVLLPCGTDVELERDGNTFKADHWNHTLTAFRDAPENKSGKQVALFSIKEAEAALAQKGGKDNA